MSQKNYVGLGGVFMSGVGSCSDDFIDSVLDSAFEVQSRERLLAVSKNNSGAPNPETWIPLLSSRR